MEGLNDRDAWRLLAQRWQATAERWEAINSAWEKRGLDAEWWTVFWFTTWLLTVGVSVCAIFGK